ncbi:hypothetical protein NMC94_02545 [Morganella morganii]
MTLNRLCSGFLFCCALLFTFPALSAAATPETASQVFIYGQLPPPEAIHRVVSSGPPTDQLLFAVAPEKLPGFASLSVKNNPYFAPAGARCRSPDVYPDAAVPFPLKPCWRWHRM